VREQAQEGLCLFGYECNRRDYKPAAFSNAPISSSR
jgi:hypothetical protein